MSTTFKRMVAPVLTVLGIAIASQAYAAAQQPVAAIDFTSPGAEFTNAKTFGFSFSVTKNELATSLGVFDSVRDGDGLIGDAQVALWDSTGKELALVTIQSRTDNSSGPGSFLDGYFRYVTLSSFVELKVGTTYVIGAHSTNPISSLLLRQGGVGGVNAESYVTLIRAENSTSGGFSFPQPSSGGTGGAWLGPNFLIAQVPEPETFQMLALGLLAVTGAAALRRRRQH